jgi:DNA invertase Pin-like site-specific DNA recombinase
MTFAYLRVSSRSQELNRQREILDTYAEDNAVAIDRVFEEKASGKDFSRQVYQSLKLTLRQGDILIITELDRLGRNMEQIKTEWLELERVGVELIVIESDLLSTADKTDLERKLISNIVFELLSYVAEKERIKINERQRVGIKLAQQAGKYKGRGRIVVDASEFGRVYADWRTGKIKAVEAMRKLGLSKDTWYRRVREHEREYEKEHKAGAITA